MKPHYVQVRSEDNVAIIVNPEGLPAGTGFDSGLSLNEAVPHANKVALVDIATGQPIRRYGAVIGYAERDIPAGAWVREELVRMPGAPLTDSVFPSSESGGLAATIPLGMRAVSLHVEEYAGVTEIVESGDRVDIYMASDRRTPGRRDIAVTAVLENIEVIDTGRWDNQPGRQAPLPVVTVIVNYEDARALSLADQSGAIRLALRNPTDGNISLQAGSPAQQAQAAKGPANGSTR